MGTSKDSGVTRVHLDPVVVADAEVGAGQLRDGRVHLLDTFQGLEDTVETELCSAGLPWPPRPS